MSSAPNSGGPVRPLRVQTVYQTFVILGEIRLDRESDEVMLSAGDWLTTNRPDDM